MSNILIKIHDMRDTHYVILSAVSIVLPPLKNNINCFLEWQKIM